ncbi:DUF6350 family protein [Gulosibacter hominis]|uniref:cell division protein PerM n=1 Tax=Gulosibacter hominis TaxID=2770504 RepID=UPI00191AC87E|nr:DUF6350 family protein [Gulosibacter hominis]
MFRPLTLISLIADALLCVAVGLGVPALVGAINWLATQGWVDTPFSAIITAATAVWGLGLGGEVTFTIDPATYPQLGLAEPFSFMVSVAPLLFTVLIAVFGWRAGARMTIDENELPWFEFVIGVAAFVGAAVVSLQLTTPDVVAVNVTSAVVPGALAWLLAMLAGMRVWEFIPWERWLGEKTDLVFELAGRAARVAAGLVVGVFGLASLALLVAFFIGTGRVIALQQALQLDISGVVTVGLAHLAYLPTAVVWAASWLLGSGFALGEGAYSQLGGTHAGPLPAIPLLGLVPEGELPALWALVALPLALAIALCLIDRMLSPNDADRPWYLRLLPGAVGGLLAAVALSLCGVLARGSLGPGRLSDFGPHPGWMLLAAVLIFMVAACVGTFVPLEMIGMDAAAKVLRPAPVASTATQQGETVTSPAAREPAEAKPPVSPVWPGSPGETVLPVSSREPGLSWFTDDPFEAEPYAAEIDEHYPVAQPEVSQPEGSGDRAKRPDAHWSRADGSAAVDASEGAAGDGRKAQRRDPKEVSRRDLSEVLRRPDEPDIYADLDEDL